MGRRPFICGNWKLHHSREQTERTLEEIAFGLVGLEHLEVAVAPVATLLFAACQKVRVSSLQIAAQNVFHKDHGAYTGEWSVHHLLELGCRMAIVGHSERRQYFGETSESVAQKASACMNATVTPIVCLGESLVERQSGRTFEVLSEQLKPVLQALAGKLFERCIVAYEPVWAIGTGQNASSDQAEEVHAFLRGQIAESFGASISEQTRIIYGGSVKPDNAADLMQKPNVDGALVGGASLNAESFLAIVRAAGGA